MVFYFSGTGNSRFAAERIAKAIGQEAHDITVYTKKKIAPDFTEPGPYVFACPSYMSALAKAITDFISWASFPKGAKTYFVVTCAASMGITPRVGAELCEQTGLEYMGSAQVVMPQNYIALFTTKGKDDNSRIINEALPVIDLIAETVKNGEKLELTNKEFDLLWFLASNPNHVYTKEELFRIREIAEQLHFQDCPKEDLRS